MFYLIVKDAADGYWEEKFKKDPKTTPVGSKKSAFYTPEGRVAGCKLWYNEKNLEEAKEHCGKLNQFNPNKGWAICPMKE